MSSCTDTIFERLTVSGQYLKPITQDSMNLNNGQYGTAVERVTISSSQVNIQTSNGTIGLNNVKMYQGSGYLYFISTNPVLSICFAQLENANNFEFTMFTFTGIDVSSSVSLHAIMETQIKCNP